MRTFTLADLVSRCKQRADMENSAFISDAEWKGLISTVYGELFSVLVASGLRYFEAIQSITTNGSATYTLPTGYLATIGVDYVVNATTGERRALGEMMVQERNRYRATGASQSRMWATVAADLVLFPTPPSGQTYEHVYVPQPVDHSSSEDGTVVDVVTPDGENFIIWAVAVLAMSKEDTNVDNAKAERDRALGRLEEWAVLRAINSPRRRIVDEGEYSYRDEIGGWLWR